MNSILIIGYGNPFRCDDGVGFHAAAQYERSCRDPAVHVLAASELTPGMAEEVANAELVVFVNASKEDGVPGSVREQQILPRKAPAGVLSPELMPDELLSLAETYYHRCPPAVMLSVCGHDFGFSPRLSAPVAAALPRLFQYFHNLAAGAYVDTARLSA